MAYIKIFQPLPINPVMNFQALIEMYKISPRYTEFLNRLNGYHVVIIADDSGSMTERPNFQAPTRWEDLLGMIDLVIRGSAIFDMTGIDVHFLNRGSIIGVKDPSQLVNYRDFPHPSQSTPLVTIMQKVMMDYSHYDKPILLVVATDGHPSEGEDKFIALMKHREHDQKLREQFALSFLMCTDEEKVVKFYDKMKDKHHYHHVEVTETYVQEYDEVINELHKDSFTPGDHIIKMLLGPIVPEIAEIDQPKRNNCVIS